MNVNIKQPTDTRGQATFLSYCCIAVYLPVISGILPFLMSGILNPKLKSFNYSPPFRILDKETVFDVS